MLCDDITRNADGTTVSIFLCTQKLRVSVSLIALQVHRSLMNSGPYAGGGGVRSNPDPKLACYHAYIYFDLRPLPRVPWRLHRAREDELQSEINITKYFRVADPTMMGEGDTPNPTDHHINVVIISLKIYFFGRKFSTWRHNHSQNI